MTLIHPRRALLVGTEGHRDPRLSRLRSPSRDIKALADVLRDPAIGDFAVTTLLDGSVTDVKVEIERQLMKMPRESLTVVYFACHGIKDANGHLHLACADTDIDLLAATGLSAGWLAEVLHRSPCRSIVLLLDCCYGGAYARGMRPRGDDRVELADELAYTRPIGRGLVVLTACTSTEYAYEDGTLKIDDTPRTAVFTRTLVEGLRSGAADRDHDGFVGVTELYEYVTAEIAKITTMQSPTCVVHEMQGDIRVARNPEPFAVAPAALATELSDATEDPQVWKRAGAVVWLGELYRSGTEAEKVRAKLELRRLASDVDDRVRARAEAELQRDERASSSRNALRLLYWGVGALVLVIVGLVVALVRVSDADREPSAASVEPTYQAQDLELAGDVLFVTTEANEIRRIASDGEPSTIVAGSGSL